MAPDVAPIERLEEHPIAVDPRAIEEEFSRIWRETAGSGHDESSIRVRVLNLVAVATKDADLERVEEAMQVLPRRHPCRGIVAFAGAPYDRLGATISAHCWRPTSGRRTVCSEEVLLTGGPGQKPELASAVLGLLVPDLPVAVWLVSSPDLHDDLAQRLTEAADRVLLDSARTGDLATAYAACLELREEHGVMFTDLAWARPAAWRALVAQLFDGADGAREVETIESIEIRGGTGAASSEALLTAGWLISRLGLEPADVTTRHQAIESVLYGGTRGIRLTVGSADDGGVLDSLHIRTVDASFRIERHHASGHLHVCEDWDSGSMQRTVEQMPEDEGSVVAFALDSGADADISEAATRAALTMLGG